MKTTLSCQNAVGRNVPQPAQDLRPPLLAKERVGERMPFFRFIPHRSRNQTGSAVLVVLVLLFLMTALLVANNRTLTTLHANLKLIEQKQLKHAGAPANPTNAVAEPQPVGRASSRAGL